MAAQIIKVHLRFDAEEFQWFATINGVQYAKHRFESRAYKVAQAAYLEQLSAKETGKEIEFEQDLEWPPQMRRALLELKKAEHIYETAKYEYEKLLGQYIAGWQDHGVSATGAAILAGVLPREAFKFIQMSGDLSSAAKALWRLVPPPPENGAIGRYSERTNTYTRKTPESEEEEET